MTFKLARGGSRAAATSKMERFVIIVNGFQPLTIITKRSILDVAAALDPPLLATSVELDGVSNLNWSIWGLINITKFFRNCFGCGFNHIYCDLVEHFLQYGSHRLCLENSLGGEVSPHLYSFITVGVSSHVLIFYFIIWLLEGSLESHQSFVARCVSIGTRGRYMENGL